MNVPFGFFHNKFMFAWKSIQFHIWNCEKMWNFIREIECVTATLSSLAESVKDYFLTLAVYITNLNDAFLQPASTVGGSACLLYHLEFIKVQFGLTVFRWQIIVVHVSLFTYVLGEDT